MEYTELIIDGVKVLEGKNVIAWRKFKDGVHEYKTEDKFLHLMINGKDILDGKKAIDYWYHKDGVIFTKQKIRNGVKFQNGFEEKEKKLYTKKYSKY